MVRGRSLPSARYGAFCFSKPGCLYLSFLSLRFLGIFTVHCVELTRGAFTNVYPGTVNC